MAKGILGKKVGMTQIFSETGSLIPVTVIEVTPNVVLQKKTVETDGYNAVQLGYADKREKLANKPETVAPVLFAVSTIFFADSSSNL